MVPDELTERSEALESAAIDQGHAEALLVSERFVSLQGEGVSQGKPAAFLRLGRCNLSCSFCDTPYTWDFSRFALDQELTWVGFQALVDWTIESSPGRMIVTGGEPLLQHKPLLRFIRELDARASELGRSREVLEVETNGTLAPPAELLSRVDQWNVSPKLRGSGQSAAKALRPGPLGVFAAHPSAFFKFVVTGSDDAEQAMGLCSTFEVPSERVLFMPEATDALALRARAPEVAGLALRYRVNYSGRLHLELFGGGRGV